MVPSLSPNKQNYIFFFLKFLKQGSLSLDLNSAIKKELFNESHKKC